MPDDNDDTQDDRYVITITWGLAGSLGIQPIVFIKPPDWAEDSRCSQRGLLEQIAEVAKWADHGVEIMHGNVVPCVMVKVNAAHLNEKKPPVYIRTLIKRLKAAIVDGIDIPRCAEFEVLTVDEARAKSAKALAEMRRREAEGEDDHG